MKCRNNRTRKRTERKVLCEHDDTTKKEKKRYSRPTARCQLTNVVLILGVLFVQMGQQLNFRLGLHQKGLLGLDDFDGHFDVVLQVVGPDHLSERSLADPFLDAVPTLVEQLPGIDDVVVVVVVPTVVVRPGALLGRRLLGRRLAVAGRFLGRGGGGRQCALLLFGLGRLACFSLLVVDIVDVFVGIDQR